MPPSDVLLDVVEAYFQYCHMQPLWLFDRSDLRDIENCREEIIYAVLALSLCHSNHPFFAGRSDEMSQKYAQLAREHLMLTVVQGRVSLATIQCLSILALANLQGDPGVRNYMTHTNILKPTICTWCHYILISLPHF